MKAFILAGGKGTRLRPLTYEVPKPLITVQKKPILSYLVEMFARHGVNHFFVSINASHADDFERWRRERHPDLRLDLIIEREPLGTFGALMLAKDQLAPTGSSGVSGDAFFMSNGDELKGFDLETMKQFHHDEGAIATIGLVEVSEPQHYGVAVREGTRITHFLEKPKDPPAKHINSGLYLLSPAVFDYFPHPKPAFSMVEQDLFPRLAAERKLHGHALEGQWYDCGTFERWEKAIKEWGSATGGGVKMA